MNDSDKALEAAIKQIEKSFGEGAIMRLGENQYTKIDFIPTGCLPLDLALGIGGIPRGRVTEIYGMESTAKSSLSLHVIAQAQKAGGACALIDSENAADKNYSEALGVNVDELLISQPSTGEEALEITDTLVRSGAIDLVVIDSVAALVPRAELEGDMFDNSIGLQARLMSQAMRKLSGSLRTSNTAAVFINQLRSKIGGMSYGPQSVTSGGLALKFYASVRLELRIIEKIKDSLGNFTGSRIKANVVKNKCAPPLRTCEFEIEFGRGISHEASLIDLGMQYGFVKRAGTWYSYEETKLGQGKENAKDFLAENTDIAITIEKRIRDNLELVPAIKGQEGGLND